MKKVDKVLRQLLEAVGEKPYYYVGNCVNSFDSEDGSCDLGIFDDVSEFAYWDERAAETEENSGDMSMNDFIEYVNVPQFLELSEEKFKYLYYGNGILVAYNILEDIHYFFSK